jgi:hypothetical protein
MLAAHGQRPSAPLELFKLEEQRVNAEFAPQLEQARLRVAAAEVALNAAPPALLEKLTDARVNASVAEAKKAEAATALARFESGWQKLGSGLVSVLVIVLIAVGLFIFFRAALKAGAILDCRGGCCGRGRSGAVGVLANSIQARHGTLVLVRGEELESAGQPDGVPGRDEIPRAGRRCAGTVEARPAPQADTDVRRGGRFGG